MSQEFPPEEVEGIKEEFMECLSTTIVRKGIILTPPRLDTLQMVMEKYINSTTHDPDAEILATYYVSNSEEESLMLDVLVEAFKLFRERRGLGKHGFIVHELDEGNEA